MENKSWTLAKILQFLAFTTMFILIPAGTWYYLKSGRDHRRAAVAELKNWGKIPSFTFQNQDDQPFSEKKALGKTVVFSFSKKWTAENVDTRLMDQFENRPEVLFCSISPDSSSVLKTLFSKLYPKGNPNWQLLMENNSDFSSKIKAAAESAGQLAPLENLIALADSTSTFRHFYDATDRADRVKLVEHIAIMLPPK